MVHACLLEMCVNVNVRQPMCAGSYVVCLGQWQVRLYKRWMCRVGDGSSDV